MSVQDDQDEVEWALRCADSQKPTTWVLVAAILAGEVRRLRVEKKQAMNMMLDSYNAVRQQDERVLELEARLREQTGRHQKED